MKNKPDVSLKQSHGFLASFFLSATAVKVDATKIVSADKEMYSGAVDEFFGGAGEGEAEAGCDVSGLPVGLVSEGEDGSVDAVVVGETVAEGPDGEVVLVAVGVAVGWAATVPVI